MNSCKKDFFLYFAYGSNLLTKRIHIQNPSAVAKGVGKLDNYQLSFGHHSERWHGAAATIEQCQGSHVYGVIWKLHNDHLATLDDQEGVPQKVYKRIEVKATEMVTGEEVHCVSYQLLPDRIAASKSKLPSKVYKDVIVHGAKENGLPPKYVEFLEGIKDNGYNGAVNVKLNLDVN